MLPVAVALFSFEGVAIRYLLTDDVMWNQWAESSRTLVLGLYV